MDVIASTAFGIRTDSYKSADDPFVRHASKAFSTSSLNPISMLAFLVPGLGALLKKLGISAYYPKDCLEFFTNVVHKILDERTTEGETGRVDLLQLMLNAENSDADKSNQKLTVEEIVAQSFLVFVAGYETTSTLLMYAAYVLATHPDIQDALIAEVDNCFPEDVKDIKYDVVMEMPYLDQVVCETLRMYPPVLQMNRTTGDEDVQVDGHWFPRNTMVTFHMYRMHHDERNFEEPEKFLPERFSPEEKAKRDPFTFMPFGQGPRNCIGMRLAVLEAKIALVAVLRKLKFVKCAETEEPLDLLLYETFLRPKKPVKVSVELR